MTMEPIARAGRGPMMSGRKKTSRRRAASRYSMYWELKKDFKRVSPWTR
jgi:hypothetical protein